LPKPVTQECMNHSEDSVSPACIEHVLHCPTPGNYFWILDLITVCSYLLVVAIHELTTTCTVCMDIDQSLTLCTSSAIGATNSDTSFHTTYPTLHSTLCYHNLSSIANIPRLLQPLLMHSFAIKIISLHGFTSHTVVCH
jgi:hypothetical protein